MIVAWDKVICDDATWLYFLTDAKRRIVEARPRAPLVPRDEYDRLRQSVVDALYNRTIAVCDRTAGEFAELRSRIERIGA